MQYVITFLPGGVSTTVDAGATVLSAQIAAGLKPDAPCGGRGTCGKCLVTLEDGSRVLACRTRVDRDMAVTVESGGPARILTGGTDARVAPDGEDRCALAFDIGTTTIVAYLLDGATGEELAVASCLNPQGQYGADVISRIQRALEGGGEALSGCVRGALAALAQEAAARAGVSLADVTRAAIAGNTAMHHLLLGIDPRPLVTPPYMPAVSEAIERDAAGLLPIRGGARLLPNIAGFVGGDTVGCLVATRFDRLEELTLMIDIGTNGEMVLGDRRRRVACSTAAGPAFEGAKISCGMRGVRGAVDHVWIEGGRLRHSVIDGVRGVGLCGSGLLDLTACLLNLGAIDESGRMEAGDFRLEDSDVVLTQKDVREVQLAKAAIRAGIELLAGRLGAAVGDIRRVLLAGAFGNYMDPASACRIGMIPPALADRIVPIGNAAGEGAKRCALSRAEFEYSRALARDTEFLELASLPEYQDCYVDALEFEE